MKNGIDNDAVLYMKSHINKRYEHLMTLLDSALDEKSTTGNDFSSKLDLCLAVSNLIAPLNILYDDLS